MGVGEKGVCCLAEGRGGYAPLDDAAQDDVGQLLAVAAQHLPRRSGGRGGVWGRESAGGSEGAELIGRSCTSDGGDARGFTSKFVGKL